MAIENKYRHMKKIKSILVIISLLLISSFSFSQESEKRDVDNFYSVTVIGNIRCELYKAEKPGLELIIKGTGFENIITENDAGRLSLRLKTNTSKDAEVNILVSYTSLEEINVQAQALVVSPEVLEAENILFTSKAGGKMELKLNLASLEAVVKQGGILVFSGEVKKQNIEVTTGGTYSAFELLACDSYVKAVSGGKAKLVARRIIDATANSKAFISYKGDPVSSSVKTSLGGQIDHNKEPID